MSIFGSIGHFLFGGKAKSDSQSTSNSTSSSTTTTAPYAGVQSQLDDYIKSLSGTYGPGGAPQISPLEQSGYDALQKTAGASPGVDAANAENTKTINGDYLTPETNPYLADIAKRVGAQALQTTNSTFGGMGRTGGGLHATEAGTGVGNALTDLYGGEYDKERGRQAAAVAGAPALDAARYTAPGALVTAGQQVSARPFDVSAQYSGILDNIARLGQTTSSTGTNAGQTWGATEGQKESSGLMGNLINKFFGV